MRKILIVEDNEDARDMLAEIITLCGHTPIPCSNSKECELALESHAFHMAILDIGLPGEHGVSISWKIRQRFPDLPILVLSAYLEDWEEEDLFDCGANMVMNKPASVTSIEHAIGELIESAP